MNLLTIRPATAFLPELARLWREQAGGGHDGLILLPTRRAARALAAAFLQANAGGAMLLPRIVGFAGLDEAPLVLAGALTLPPAIEEAHRRAMLATLIRARQTTEAQHGRTDGAWRLAGELARLMDEAERAEIDLRAALLKAVPETYAEHWGQTLEFLAIVTDAWPAYLAEQKLINPVQRQIGLLHAQAAAWQQAPPDHPVLAVGSTGDIPAVGALLRVVATLPRGMVVLPGLDHDLDAASWEALDQTHPQFELQALLQQLGADRGDVQVVGNESARERLLRRAMLPAARLAEWQIPFPAGPAGLSLLRAASEQEEAVAIALMLRQALEQPTARAALVTPDRGLAVRVAAELLRFGVVADDSAGEKLGDTPPAVFLRLLATACTEGFSPAALLALLKHPLAAAGLAPPALRRAARRLEAGGLRGPAPPRGLPGLRSAAKDTEDTALLDRLQACLAPMTAVLSSRAAAPGELLDALLLSAEALAASDTQSGPERLWQAEEGEALADLLAETRDALDVLPPDRPDCLPGLLEALLEGAVVRSRRAIRGRGGAEHPRVFIWGLLEARLQSAELMVLGGLAEGVWPPATDPGPWMSRPMRTAAGLPSPDRRIGQAAQDFCLAACAAPQVVLSLSGRRENAPTVPSRWITRLEAMLGGLPPHPSSRWAGLLDQPAGGVRPVPRPRPCPPRHRRPRRLNVTEVGTLVADPYAIYARRILNLKRLPPLEEVADERDFGIVVHRGVQQFLTGIGAGWPADAARQLSAALRQSAAQPSTRPALAAWWGPRLDRIADWLDGLERQRRSAGGPVQVATEVKGDWALSRPGGVFTLRGRADRIERWPDGIAILDYKTGTVPKDEAVLDGTFPQLPLEACMAQAEVFGPAFAAPPREAAYWKLTGSHKPGETHTLLKGDAAALAAVITEAGERLAELIDRYDSGAGYVAMGVSADYAQLARAAEWGSLREEEETSS